MGVRVDKRLIHYINLNIGVMWCIMSMYYTRKGVVLEVMCSMFNQPDVARLLLEEHRKTIKLMTEILKLKDDKIDILQRIIRELKGV